MDRLIVCETCRHGAIAHASTGCEAANCTCASTCESLIEEAVKQAMHDIRAHYRKPG